MDRVFGNSACTTLAGMADEEIAIQAKGGNRAATEYLLAKYKGLVEGKARSYFLAGADHDDVVQEGMIGLFKAIRDFRTEKLSGFRAFADLCVTRQIITAVKSAARQKHVPLNHCVSLHGLPRDGNTDVALIDLLPDACVADPEKTLLDTDFQDRLRSRAKDLSTLEAEVFTYYVQGMTYGEMAKLLSCRMKSIDNALQRAKRKLGSRIVKD